MFLFEDTIARAFGSRRLRVAAISAAVAAAITAATHPAAASDALAILTSTVKCATSSACVTGTNTSSGAGVAGTSAKGDGVSGTSTASGSQAVGVYGTSPSGFGVFGRSLKSGGYGVYGAGDSIGVLAVSESSSGTGLTAVGNTAVSASSGHIGVTSFGADIGLVGTSQSYPLLLQNGSTNDAVFYVDSSGNVYFAGSLYAYARYQNGATVKEYSARTAAPTLEDTGTAQLVAGVAQVRLDPTFAAGIDPRVSYRVFVTPRGDTRGLYVAASGPAGFTVRETQGGRGTLSFDYRIVATQLGHPGERMAAVNAALMPHGPQQSAMPALKAPPLS